MVLFANYKTYAIAVDDKGKKHKAQGGTRVMYTSHHPCWDAKNRAGLPPELPFDYQEIAFIFNHTPEPVHKKPVPEVNPEPPVQQPTMEVSNKEEGPEPRKEKKLRTAKTTGFNRKAGTRLSYPESLAGSDEPVLCIRA